jgi:hypothetical protein
MTKTETYKAKARYERERGKAIREEVKLEKYEDKAKTKSRKFLRSKTLVGKPKVSLSSYSPEKAIRRIANDSPKNLVRPVEDTEIVQDNRSLYFKEEFKNQKEKTGSWLSKW